MHWQLWKLYLIHESWWSLTAAQCWCKKWSYFHLLVLKIFDWECCICRSWWKQECFWRLSECRIYLFRWYDWGGKRHEAWDRRESYPLFSSFRKSPYHACSVYSSCKNCYWKSGLSPAGYQSQNRRNGPSKIEPFSLSLAAHLPKVWFPKASISALSLLTLGENLRGYASKVSYNFFQKLQALFSWTPKRVTPDWEDEGIF